MNSAKNKNPVLDSTGFLVFILLLVLVGVACSPTTPTPTPEVTPTRTPRATRTAFPTLTPRASRTPTISSLPAVVTDTLRVREQPSTSAKILGRLQKDAQVVLLSRTEDSQWFSIEFPQGSGQSGWIFGEVLQVSGDVTKLTVGFAAPKPPEGAIFATVKGEGGSLRMRAGPGTSYEVVARIPDKARITLIAKLLMPRGIRPIIRPVRGQRVG